MWRLSVEDGMFDGSDIRLMGLERWKDIFILVG